MKTHILYPDHVIHPEGRRMVITHPELGPLRKVHSAVLETLGQGFAEDSPRNRVLPYGEDALCEGRVLAALQADELPKGLDLIHGLADRMRKSRRTLKDQGASHPLGRFHSSAVLAGLVNEDPAVNQAAADAFEEPCEEARRILMPEGLTVYPFAGREAALVVVRPFYACDRSYLKEGPELAAYNNFY